MPESPQAQLVSMGRRLGGWGGFRPAIVASGLYSSLVFHMCVGCRGAPEKSCANGRRRNAAEGTISIGGLLRVECGEKKGGVSRFCMRCLRLFCALFGTIAYGRHTRGERRRHAAVGAPPAPPGACARRKGGAAARRGRWRSVVTAAGRGRIVGIARGPTGERCLRDGRAVSGAHPQGVEIGPAGAAGTGWAVRGVTQLGTPVSRHVCGARYAVQRRRLRRRRERHWGPRGRARGSGKARASGPSQRHRGTG
jgi:hypothetical protein